ncbi:MAG: tyrosine-type recombinase/integrase [Desulfamplus sp.]|nr:tyrosine-type recombinase/integrase [Desulfamplus sp.]
MAITQKKDGRWCVHYYGPDKRKRFEYFGRGLEAQQKTIERNNELKSQNQIREYVKRDIKILSPTFGELANEYIKAKAIELPKTSIDNLYYKLTGVILPEIGDIEALRLTHSKIREYIKKRLSTIANTKTGKTISKTTVHRELSDIQAILNWAVNEKYIQSNPLAGFKKPTRDDEIILPPTFDEIQRILSCAPEHLKRSLIISFYTGLRPGVAELFSLKWADINFESGIIHIISAKKGGLKDRFIPLHPDFRLHLEHWKTADNINSDININSASRLLNNYIILWKGQKVKSIKKSFITAKAKAGITRRLRLYDFRHAFATNILKAGGDLKSTSEMLGHTRTDTTSRIYQHTDIDMHRTNINLIPSLNFNKDKHNG